MVLIFREQLNISNFLRISEKKVISRVTAVFQFSWKKKKRSAAYIFFFRQRICKLFCPFLLLGFENIDLFRLFPKFYLLESFIPSVIRFCIPNLSKLFIIGLVIFFWRCFNIHNMNYTARWICVFVQIEPMYPVNKNRSTVVEFVTIWLAKRSQVSSL